MEEGNETENRYGQLILDIGFLGNHGRVKIMQFSGWEHQEWGHVSIYLMKVITIYTLYYPSFNKTYVVCLCL